MEIPQFNIGCYSFLKYTRNVKLTHSREIPLNFYETNRSQKHCEFGFDKLSLKYTMNTNSIHSKKSWIEWDDQAKVIR